MRLAIALLVLFVPAAAFAQDSHPAALGKPHLCERHDYPAAAKAMGVEGATKLFFHIEPDGTVKDIAVQQSSGNIYLDQASLACAASWTYRPAMQNGQAVEVPWHAVVDWRIVRGETPNTGAAPQVQASHDCPARPRDPANTAEPGTVVLTYGVDVDGAVVNMTVQDSSGDKAFDDYAAACVSAWHFKPTRIDGVPKRVYETTRLAWKPAP